MAQKDPGPSQARANLNFYLSPESVTARSRHNAGRIPCFDTSRIQLLDPRAMLVHACTLSVRAVVGALQLISTAPPEDYHPISLWFSMYNTERIQMISITTYVHVYICWWYFCDVPVLSVFCKLILHMCSNFKSKSVLISLWRSNLSCHNLLLPRVL